MKIHALVLFLLFASTASTAYGAGIDVADLPATGTPATATDGIIVYDSSEIAGARLSLIDFSGTATECLNGAGGWSSFLATGDDLGAAVASDVVALWASGACSGYLKSDGSCDTPSGTDVTLATGVNALTLTAQEIGVDSTIEQLADLTPTNNALLGFDGSGNIANKTSINIDIYLGVPTDATVADIFGKDANGNITLGVSGSSTNTFWRGNDSATNGDTTQVWSADKVYDQLALKQDKATFPVSFCVAISDETTDLTTGTAKTTFRAPYAFTLTSLRSSVNTAPVGATIIIDVNEAGATVMTTNKLSIDASELTSVTAATAHTLTDTAIADDASMTIDIDQVGSSTAGKGAKVCFYGTRSL